MAVRGDGPPGRDQCLGGDLAAEGAQRRSGVAPAAEQVELDLVEMEEIGEVLDRDGLRGLIGHLHMVADVTGGRHRGLPRRPR
ncbi:hypothetical protein ACFQZC_32245 [Streptacidiphilus monticola]